MTFSYTDATKVQEELRSTTAFASTTNPSSDTVTRWITEASDLITDMCGTPFTSQSYTEYFDYSGEDRIQLRYSPLLAVTSFEYNTASLGETETWVSKTEGTHFIKYPQYSELLLVSSKFAPNEGNRNIKVTYTAGYSTVPLKVQALATKMVAHRVLSSLISNNINEGNDGGSISVGSISIVEPASYGVNSYKQLKQDIADLSEEITSGFKVLRY